MFADPRKVRPSSRPPRRLPGGLCSHHPLLASSLLRYSIQFAFRVSSSWTTLPGAADTLETVSIPKSSSQHTDTRRRHRSYRSLTRLDSLIINSKGRFSTIPTRPGRYSQKHVFVIRIYHFRIKAVRLDDLNKLKNVCNHATPYASVSLGECVHHHLRQYSLRLF